LTDKILASLFEFLYHSSVISSLLIANRGEIAARIAKTCRKLGITTYGLKAAFEPHALYHDQVDHVLELLGANLLETYLNAEQILSFVKENDIDAIHPGYGFLSENAGLPELCQKSGIIWIGPQADVIKNMGSKAVSKTLAIEAGLPVIPGYQGEDQSEETLFAEAKKIGFPVLIKASAGGGGKGMRVAEDEKSFSESLQSAKSEAENSFGDGRLLLEKYLSHPNHIEAQVFGDKLGNVVHLGERDCSLQRRHQKVIEESPAPNLDPKLRDKLLAAAVSLTESLKYEGAGTIEFLVQDGQFYFLEMNTRLQVEHPVTEMRTGVDLVEWQIKVGSGEELPLKQSEISFNGWAMEARLYAEDPENQFFPQTGKIHYWKECDEEVRTDSGVHSGQEVSSYFDPMLAKVICFEKTRDEAAAKLAMAMREMVILGLKTNQGYLADILESSEFLDVTQINTQFLPNHFSDWSAQKSLENQQMSLEALPELIRFTKNQVTTTKSTDESERPSEVWLTGFRLG
jgi:3-methylcrotonyl-CoA carboxylase alpha subunit